MNALELEETIQGLAEALLERSRLAEGVCSIKWSWLLPERQAYWRNIAEAAYAYMTSQPKQLPSSTDPTVRRG